MPILANATTNVSAVSAANHFAFLSVGMGPRLSIAAELDPTLDHVFLAPVLPAQNVQDLPSEWDSLADTSASMLQLMNDLFDNLDTPLRTFF